MCPACMATAALMAAGATSSGGLTAFIASKFHRRRNRSQQTGTRAGVTKLERKENGNDKRSN